LRSGTGPASKPTGAPPRKTAKRPPFFAVGPDGKKLNPIEQWKIRHARKKSRLAAMTRKRRIWRRVGVYGTWLLAGFTVLVLFTTFAFYHFTNVPSPESLRTDQVSVISFSDGSEMARIGAVDRTSVSLSKVPASLKWAVLAAEDRGFYEDPGFSVKGTVRALLNDVRGGDAQGGSGITQQYVKNAYLNADQTLSRKVKELAIAVKLNRNYSKDQILEWYLNTIYFGRGAYGVEAAAETYFGITVDKLTLSQGALLAAILNAPSYFDPATNLGPTKDRWTWVLDGMVTTKHLTAAEATAAQFPDTLPPSGSRLGVTGPNAHIVNQVEAELAKLGYSEDSLNRLGLRVQTTIIPAAQQAAVDAIKTTYDGQPSYLREALVSVVPTTGAVVAYYGYSADKPGFDFAQAWRQPGSSFKPYVLATALQQNVTNTAPAGGKKYTLQSVFDGSTPRTIDGQVVNNSDGESCSSCSLADAMKLSINTVYYDLASKVGPANVAKLAKSMGIPANRTDDGTATLELSGTTDDRIGIGGYEVRPIDQAAGFGVFATGGVKHSTYFVQSITDSSGKKIYDHADDAVQVLDPKVANDVSVSLRPIASYSNDGLAGSRHSEQQQQQRLVDGRLYDPTVHCGVDGVRHHAGHVRQDRTHPLRLEPLR
jgi:membrane peptidoglycan carboxypeptidase